MNQIMELFIKDNGLKMALDMDEACKFGKMDQNMKAIGATIWPTAKAD